jgi:hypothetical protein
MALLRKAGESLPQTKSEARPATLAKTTRRWAIAAIMTPDFQAVFLFCLIGLLLALNAILRFPDLGAVIEEFNRF